MTIRDKQDTCGCKMVNARATQMQLTHKSAGRGRAVSYNITKGTITAPPQQKAQLKPHKKNLLPPVELC